MDAAGFKKALQDEYRGHAVNNPFAFQAAHARIIEYPIGGGAGQALVEEMDWQLEMTIDTGSEVRDLF